jgi:hypothetical protein
MRRYPLWRPGSDACRFLTRRASLGRATVGSLPGRGVLLAHQVRYDVRASLRNPRARFFTFFFPVVLLVIFTGVFGHGTT